MAMIGYMLLLLGFLIGMPVTIFGVGLLLTTLKPKRKEANEYHDK